MREPGQTAQPVTERARPRAQGAPSCHCCFQRVPVWQGLLRLLAIHLGGLRSNLFLGRTPKLTQKGHLTRGPSHRGTFVRASRRLVAVVRVTTAQLPELWCLPRCDGAPWPRSEVCSPSWPCFAEQQKSYSSYSLGTPQRLTPEAHGHSQPCLQCLCHMRGGLRVHKQRHHLGESLHSHVQFLSFFKFCGFQSTRLIISMVCALEP